MLIPIIELLVKEGIYEDIGIATKAIKNGEVRVGKETALVNTQLFAGHRVILSVKHLDPNWLPSSRYVKKQEIEGKQMSVFGVNDTFEVLELLVRHNI